jgi:prepilin-type N-terminal cleavage/methylation domain-containing protein
MNEYNNWMKNIFVKNNNGFSLPEVMMALGLLGAVSLGVMKLMENSSKASKNIEIKDQMIQVQREVSDILSNPNNCEASLHSKTIDGNIPIIYQVVKGVPTPKYSVGSEPAPGVKIEGMKLKSIDGNGSDGSIAIATLELSLRKNTKIHLGGQVLKKEIKLNANLCKKNMIDDATLPGIMAKCSGPNNKLLEGPNQWNGSYWAVCQDCSQASSNIIQSCQSTGTGGGVDIANLSKMQCQSLGGYFDEPTLECKLDEVTAASACASLGGVFNAGKHECTFSGAKLADFIGMKIDSLMPSCIMTPAACSGIHGNNMGSYIVKQDSGKTYTWYTVSCRAHFRRISSPWVQKQWCASHYSAYGHCGWYGPRVHDHGFCTVQGRSSNIQCSNNHGQKQHQNCFVFDYDKCEVTNTEQRTEEPVDVRVNKCCK